MIQIVLTPEQNRVLSQANEPVEIVDGRGRVLSRISDGWTNAEVSDALLNAERSGMGGTLEELVSRLERDYPIAVN